MEFIIPITYQITASIYINRKHYYHKYHVSLRGSNVFYHYCRGRRTFLGITPKYICAQRYYPLDLKVRKNELIAFKVVAYAIVQQLYKHFSLIPQNPENTKSIKIKNSLLNPSVWRIQSYKLKSNQLFFPK
jgi:hypothetical protein